MTEAFLIMFLVAGVGLLLGVLFAEPFKRK